MANMEDPLTMSATDAFNMLDDSGLPSFSYPDAYLDYQVPDFFNPSYLSGAHLTTTTTSFPSDDTPHSALTATPSNAPLDFPKPHDDLSHFFADSPFSSPGPNQRYAPMKGQMSQGYSPAWGSQEGWSHNNGNNANNHINNNNNSNQASGSQQPLAILTSGFEPGDARTVVHHGQVTPGDSPETATSPGPGKGRAASSRRASRKGKESISSIATTATSASATSSRDSGRDSSGRRDSAITAASSPPSPAPAKIKKPRKPRRSSKKPTTAEQAALKRETFLKRNREAAYKCRVKKKTQTEEVVERVKALGEDNRMKSAEVERLRREVEGLRGLLLPHYRVCGDERVVAYLDGLGSVGGAWGGGAGRLGSLAGLGGEMGGLGLGGDDGGSVGGGRRESVGSAMGSEGTGSEGYNNVGEQEMDDEEEEEREREEQRRRESEDLEDMFEGSGAGRFDSGVTPGVGGMGGGGGVGVMEMGMDGMGDGMEMMGGMDEVLGLGVGMGM
ncbi:hypothetical protein VE03_04126 [Pseudogymnoascus sp. 23342-1-I1]|nr:hypothetical protein VE03_04126 [Pseudogymnoascus sp. 23342-1-I1]